MKTTTIDIVILSYSATKELQDVTAKCVETLIETETENIKFDILVLESEKKLSPYCFPGTKTIYPKEEFNFNRYLNVGVNSTCNNFICFCNNDLIFYSGWAEELLKEMDKDETLLSVSPLCPKWHPTINIYPNTGVHYGYGIRFELSGWCFLVKRSIFKKIGLFDEKFGFWYADFDYAKTLQKHNVKHALVTSSIVEHLAGISTEELEDTRRKAMTGEQMWYYSYKWEDKSLIRYIYRESRSFLRKLSNYRIR